MTNERGGEYGAFPVVGANTGGISPDTCAVELASEGIGIIEMS